MRGSPSKRKKTESDRNFSILFWKGKRPVADHDARLATTRDKLDISFALPNLRALYSHNPSFHQVHLV